MSALARPIAATQTNDAVVLERILTSIGAELSTANCLPNGLANTISSTDMAGFEPVAFI